MDEIPLEAKLIGLPLLLIGGYVTTIDPNSSTAAEILRWVILLIAAPCYTFVGPIVLYVVACFYLIFINSSPSHEIYDKVIPGFMIVGYIWVGAKVCWYAKEAVNEHKWREEARIEKAAEEKRIKKEEETAQREFEEERAATDTENRELVKQIVELVSSAGSQAAVMMRAAIAIEGSTIEVMTPYQLAITGVLQILSIFSEANGAVPDGIARLFHGIQWRLKPTTRHRVNDCIGFIEKVRQEHLAVSVPTMVTLLAAYDQMQRTKLAAKAATIYCSIVQTASCLCGNSIAVQVVAGRYIELLRPYVYPNAGNGHSANSSSSRRESSDRPAGQCPECERAYTVLGLSGTPTETEIKQAYRDLVKVWHPDRFGGSDERLRRKAGERVSEINGAYSHISKHWEPPRQ